MKFAIPIVFLLGLFIIVAMLIMAGSERPPAERRDIKTWEPGLRCAELHTAHGVGLSCWRVE